LLIVKLVPPFTETLKINPEAVPLSATPEGQPLVHVKFKVEEVRVPLSVAFGLT
jgi:hypothetical protein